MPKYLKKKRKASEVKEKSEPDHEMVTMIRYGITREMKYTYFSGQYRYETLEHAVNQAKRKLKLESK